jgi:hypothetical protein
MAGRIAARAHVLGDAFADGHAHSRATLNFSGRCVRSADVAKLSRSNSNHPAV